MKRPSDVLEIGVIQEVLVKLLHPDADLLHADAPDLGQRIPVQYLTCEIIIQPTVLRNILVMNVPIPFNKLSKCSF
jgi:hypothetical protein